MGAGHQVDCNIGVTIEASLCQKSSICCRVYAVGDELVHAYEPTIRNAHLSPSKLFWIVDNDHVYQLN